MVKKKVTIYFKKKEREEFLCCDDVTAKDTILKQANNVANGRILCFGNTIYNFDEIKKIEIEEVNG